MSFNIGEKNSRFVAVSDVTMRFKFSEKVLFADLRTSRKTGRYKTDANGEVVTDAKGKPVPERAYSHWEGRFVGNAFEPAKGLAQGQTIDIVNGWIEKEVWYDNDKKRRETVYVVIADFVLSDAGYDDDDDDDDDNVPAAADGKEVGGAQNVYRSLNGDDDTPVTR